MTGSLRPVYPVSRRSCSISRPHSLGPCNGSCLGHCGQGRDAPAPVSGIRRRRRLSPHLDGPSRAKLAQAKRSQRVTGVNPCRAADRQPNPQQQTLCDGLSHLGSSCPDRVEYRSAHDWKGWASCRRTKTRMIKLRVFFLFANLQARLPGLAAMQLDSRFHGGKRSVQGDHRPPSRRSTQPVTGRV